MTESFWIGVVCFFIGWIVRGNSRTGEFKSVISEAMQRIGKREQLYFSMNILRDSVDGNDENPPELDLSPMTCHDYRNN